MIKAPSPFIEFPEPPPPTATPTPEEPLPWGWRDVGKAVLFIIIGSLLVGAGVIAIAIATNSLPTQGQEMTTNRLHAQGQGMAAAPFFWLGALIYGVVVLAVYRFAVRRAGGKWSALGFRPFSQWWIALAPVLTLVQLFGMSIVNVLFVLPFTGGEFENPQIEALTGGSALSVRDLGWLLILVAVIAPIAEELFFRGMLYPVLRRRWSAPVAIVVNGFLFALIHFIPILIPGLFLVGIVLAWIRERSGSLLPCMLVHALQNTVVLFSIYAVMNGMAS